MSQTTRRQFAQTLAVAAAAIPAAGTLVAQTTTPAPPPTAPKVDEEAAAKTKAPSALGIALAGVVSAQSGQYLDADEMQRVYDDFQQYAPYIEGFRAYPLRNADEPDFTFHSLVDRW